MLYVISSNSQQWHYNDIYRVEIFRMPHRLIAGGFQVDEYLPKEGMMNIPVLNFLLLSQFILRKQLLNEEQ